MGWEGISSRSPKGDLGVPYFIGVLRGSGRGGKTNTLEEPQRGSVHSILHRSPKGDHGGANTLVEPERGSGSPIHHRGPSGWGGVAYL